MRWLAIPMIAVLASPAQAGTCTALLAFVIGDDVPRLTDEDAKCTSSRTLGGGQSKDCYWSFDYRSAEATQVYEQMTELLGLCADSPVEVQTAQVNHPDSFDQVLGLVEGRKVSVSLKDKGALNQTLVFLRSALKSD
jgi:hypothetical protein